MTAARNLALEALRQLDSSLQFTDWENGEGEEIGAQLRAAAAALEAETGEPVATVSISHFRGCSGMEKVDIQLSQYLPEGTHQLYTAPQTAAPQWIPVTERLPATGVLVIVRWPASKEDWTDDDRIGFDHISADYEDWNDHCESFDHYMAVGGSGAAGPDCVCTGPSQKAPYTHWMPLPAAPGAPA